MGSTAIPSVAAQASLLAIGFLLRFVYHSRVVYRPKRTTSVSFDLETIPSFLHSQTVQEGAQARRAVSNERHEAMDEALAVCRAGDTFVVTKLDSPAAWNGSSSRYGQA